MSRLFSPLTLRSVTVPHRAWVSPMCQYSSQDGHPTDWHLVHLGALARGGAGLVMTEATAVLPEGRISPDDAGIWTDEQAADYERIAAFVTSMGAVPAMQLAHAGRKASTWSPWKGSGSVPPEDGGWRTVGPSPLAFGRYAEPREASAEDLAEIVRAFGDAARRAVGAGFRALEIHAAHGYLLHSFLSPLSNRRTDAYGDDRARLLTETVDAVRAAVPDAVPLLVRVSASDWVDGGLDADAVGEVARRLVDHGVDLVDVSSGGISPQQRIPVGPAYQVPLARRVRELSGLPVAAVGQITEPAQAESVLVDGAADAVFLGRAVLREPTWPQRAARELGADLPWPPQYDRGKP